MSGRKVLSVGASAGVAMAAAAAFNAAAFATSRVCPMDKVSETNGTTVKPPFQPPGVAFSVVWPILYTLLGVVFSIYVYALSNNTAPKGWAIAAMTLFCLQLVLNYTWTPVYSCANQPVTAMYILLALTVTVVATMVSSSYVSGTATVLMAPYVVWLVFALMLNAQSIPIPPSSQ
jgi:tryptophan-rich sensory protein